MPYRDFLQNEFIPQTRGRMDDYERARAEYLQPRRKGVLDYALPIGSALAALIGAGSGGKTANVMGMLSGLTGGFQQGREDGFQRQRDDAFRTALGGINQQRGVLDDLMGVHQKMYGIGRDKIADQRYADETAYNRGQDHQANQLEREKFAFSKQKWSAEEPVRQSLANQRNANAMSDMSDGGGIDYRSFLSPGTQQMLYNQAVVMSFDPDNLMAEPSADLIRRNYEQLLRDYMETNARIFGADGIPGLLGGLGGRMGYNPFVTSQPSPGVNRQANPYDDMSKEELIKILGY